MKTKHIKYILILFLITISGGAYAQDLLLSQPFASSLYLGPSFAGMTNGGRAFLTYRNQWAGINGGYNTALFGADYFFRRQNSSVGLLLAYDRQAGGAFTTLEIHPQYNYQIKVNHNLFFRPGVELSIYYKSIDAAKLVFADQIAVDGTIIDGTRMNNLNKESGMDIDVAVSALLYNNDFWLGLAMHHITETEVSFVNDEAKTPRKWSATLGYRCVYYTDRGRGIEDAFTFAALADYQATHSQLQLGVFWHRMPLELGVWYRDLPFVAKGNLMNRDALICQAGLSFGNLKISYSYDITLSKLSGYSAGSHEVVLTVKFDQRDEHDLSFFCY